MDDLKFQLGAEVQLFKTDLVGMIDSDSGCLIIRQPNAGFDAPGMTIKEFLDDVIDILNKILGEGTISEIPLPPVIDKVTEGVSLYLKEIFMMIQTTKDPKSVEFAIWVSMDTSDKLRKMFPIAIKQGYLKVWKTTREIILDEMQIKSVQDLFDKETERKKLSEESSDSEKKEEEKK